MQRLLLVLEVRAAPGASPERTVDDVGAPVCCSSSFSNALTSPSVALISRKRAARQREQRHLPGDAALLVGVVVKLVHHDVVDVGVLRPRASAMLARISAVQQMMGASRFTVASPVIMPTLLRPELATESEELLAHERLDRARVERAPTLGDAP